MANRRQLDLRKIQAGKFRQLSVTADFRAFLLKLVPRELGLSSRYFCYGIELSVRSCDNGYDNG